MPAGRSYVSPEAVIDRAAAGTMTDNYTTIAERGIVDPYAMRTASKSSGVPDVIDMAKTGRRYRLWDQVYFGIIHVIPRVKELGGVISQTSFQVEIWNADDVAHVGQSVTITGGPGVTISAGPTLPSTWAPFSSQYVTVLVDGQGAPLVDSLITWLFPGFTGTDTRVLGFRLTIFPLGPEWDEDYQEGFGYRSSVKRARNGNEQRRQLRSRPVRELTYSAFAEDPRVAGETIVKLMKGGQFLFGVPYWPDATPLTALVSPGALSIPVDTTTRIFEAGGLLALWKDARTWETLTIAAGGVSSSALAVTSPVVGTWPKDGTYVIPVVPARLVDAAALEHPTPGVAGVRATFVTEPV